jgi:exodeoxyribonuclease VII large subunit
MSDKLSLTQLQLIIKDSLHLALPGMYWITAEISEIKENYAGHCYIELVEKHPDEINVRARVRAVIWAKRYSFLKPMFRQVTGESLREGFKVLLKVLVEYHEVYGLSLVINDIDPAFTIGEMAIKRNQILKRLEEEGVISMNKELGFPLFPKRIAVISSKNAAGYTDFINHITGNNYGYSFRPALFEASMQGTETEESIVAALDWISEQIESFDTVVIIRGGGAQTDLSWFDNYKIAYHITQFPLPVLTGIGHEKDVTVTDLVAYQSLKTPTAVADYIIDTVAGTEKYLEQISGSISELALQIINENKNRLDKNRMKLIPVAGLKISEEKKRIAVLQAYLKMNAINLVKLSFRSIETLLNHLNVINPENVLKRGFTLTSLNGQIIKNAAILREGDDIDTRFSDGSVKSKVFKVKDRRQKTKDKRQRVKDKS